MAKTVYALGFFDGVHLGHGALLTQCRELARQAGLEAGAVTFSPHPDALVFGSPPALINTPEDRDALMSACYGIRTVITLPFDRELMTLPWEAFLEMLCTHREAAGFVCGSDFRFGSQGEGTAEALRDYCSRQGLVCAVVPQLRLEGVVVSSTHIRALLQQGKLEEANRFLGHPHRLSGTVVPGQQLGRTLGLPTANLLLPPELLCLCKGAYATLAKVNGQLMPAVTNVGIRPTVGGTHTTVETWIPRFSGALYGTPITLFFHKFLRPEKKFPSLAALQAEIRKNAAEAEEFFAKSESFPLLLEKLMI